MSARLYEQVKRLYELLDVDGNGRIDRDEARLGFSACFDDVHRATESLPPKQQVIDQQVDWLFSATEHSHDSEPEVSHEEFKGCYTKLLAAAYEEEVLQLDLQRAVDSLSRSREWTSMRQMFVTARSLFRALAGSDAHDATISPADPRIKSVLERLFEHINGKSNVLGPKRQTAARRVVAPLFAADAAPLTCAALVKLIKAVLAVPVPVDGMAEDAQHALALANGQQSAAASPAVASSAMDSQ